MPRITTQKSNKNLRREYRLRFFTMLFMMLVIAVLVTVLAMIPSYTLLSIYNNTYNQAQSSREESNIQQMNFQNDQKLEAAYELALEVRQENSVYLDVIKKLDSYKGASIQFNAIELNGSNAETNITLRGQAFTREALLAFEDRINSDDSFSGFQVPIDSLTKQEDIAFNISFTHHEK